jgi:hypothetical protein
LQHSSTADAPEEAVGAFFLAGAEPAVVDPRINATAMVERSRVASLMRGMGHIAQRAALMWLKNRPNHGRHVRSDGGRPSKVRTMTADPATIVRPHLIYLNAAEDNV